MKDILLALLVCFAIAFVQFGNTAMGFIMLKAAEDKVVSMSSPYKPVDYQKFIQPIDQTGRSHQPLRLTSINSAGKNTGNPYYAQSTHNLYATWQIAP